MTITSHKQLQHTILLLFCRNITNYLPRPLSPSPDSLILHLLFLRHPRSCFTVTFSEGTSSPVSRLQLGLRSFANVSSFLKAPHRSLPLCLLITTLSAPKLSSGFAYICLPAFRCVGDNAKLD